jgi:hypothetical protein
MTEAYEIIDPTYDVVHRRGRPAAGPSIQVTLRSKI